LSHLIDNAIKFTFAGEVELTASVESRDDEKVTMHFAVRDTGIGIPYAQRDAIFEPFSQADASSTRKFGGTGIGLTLCSRIVSAMGGRIWVDSEPGTGSTFQVSVPLLLGSASPAPVVETEPLRRGCSRILLVEDNEINQRVACGILRRAGHSVVVADNGRRALEQLDSHRFDLLLMDLQMPDLGGLETTAIIRERDRAAGVHTVIIAMTAHAMSGDRERCLQAGMDDYIAKPVDGPILRDLVERYGPAHIPVA
jgi:CheY-like chemotaxis protein